MMDKTVSDLLFGIIVLETVEDEEKTKFHGKTRNWTKRRKEKVFSTISGKNNV